MASIFDEIPAITPEITHFKVDRGELGEDLPSIKFRVLGRKPWYSLEWSELSADSKSTLIALQPLIKADYQAKEGE